MKTKQFQPKRYKVNEIGKVMTVNNTPYLIMVDGRVFTFQDSDVKPFIAQIKPEETDKLALYFLEKKIEESNNN